MIGSKSEWSNESIAKYHRNEFQIEGTGRYIDLQRPASGLAVYNVLPVKSGELISNSIE